MAGPSNENGTTNEAIDATLAEVTAPTALRKLVLNYLIHHCYIDTAKAFADDGISSQSSSAPTDEVGNTTSSTIKNNEIKTSNHSRSSSRNIQNTNGGASSSAHPLSAPPISHEDSSMEVEVDSLLSLAGHDSKSTSNGHSQQQRDAANMGDEELSSEELQSVRARKEVRDAIINGRIRQAVDLLNKHFPTVLNAATDGQKSTMTTNTNQSEQQEKNGNKEIGNSNGKSDKEVIERILPANPTSLDPDHLSLNLQIQAFIESVRTASSRSNTTSPTLTSSIPSINAFQSAPAMPNMHSVVTTTPGIAAAAAAISRSASPAPSSTSSTGSVTSGNGMGSSVNSNGGSSALAHPSWTTALQHARTLHNEVRRLPAYWRSMYLKELEGVSSILAYNDLEASPVRKYLDHNRRYALAEQINSAIMFRTGKPSQPLIESAVRQTTFCWSTLAQEKVNIPSNHYIFSNGGIIGIDGFEGVGGSVGTSTAISTSASNLDRTKNKGKYLPSWNLHTFLRER